MSEQRKSDNSERRPKMEYFIQANSFAAPFFSDTSTHYVYAKSPEAALEALAKTYNHPAGLFAADCYASADDMHKGKKPLARWLCNRKQAEQSATRGMGAYSFYSDEPGTFEVNGKKHVVKEPKGGSIVSV